MASKHITKIKRLQRQEKPTITGGKCDTPQERKEKTDQKISGRLSVSTKMT